MMKFIEQHFYRCILTLLATVGVADILSREFNLQVSIVLILLISLFWTGSYRFLDRAKKKWVILPLFALIIVILVLTKRVDSTFFTNWITWWETGAKRSEQKGYCLLTVLVAALPIVVFFYYLARLFVTRAVTALGFLAMLVTMSLVKSNPSQLATLCLLIYCSFIGIELVQRVLYRDRSDRADRATVFLGVPVAILFILLLFTPVRPGPIKWTTVKRVWNQVVSSVETMFNNIRLSMSSSGESEFSIDFDGYSDSSEIGGNISQGQKHILTVDYPAFTSSAHYLIGNYQNYYDGRNWTQQFPEATGLEKYSENELDICELFYALTRAGLEKKYRNICVDRSCEVEFEFTKTKTIFFPLKSSFFDYDARDSVSNQYWLPLFDEMQATSTKYKVEYYQMNLGSSHLREFLLQQSYHYDGSYVDTARTLPYAIGKVANSELFREIDTVLRQRADLIQEGFTGLPETLPQRVYDLAEQLTEDCENDYDKMRVLEQYLHNQYAYTTAPGEIPEGYDVADYFLFENKTGYCTYFATTLCVLGRCLGIPTRYVQGFCIPSVQSTYSYKVMGKDAHAWTEAYFEGIGWIPFEPTTSYDARYVPWNFDGAALPDKLPEVTPFVEEEVLSPEEEAKIIADKKNADMMTIIIWLMIPFVALLTLVIYVLIRILSTKSHYKAASEDNKVYYNIKLIMALSKQLGIVLEQGETFTGFCARLSEHCGPLSVMAKNMCEVYLALRYGEIACTKEERELCERLVGEMKVQLRKIKSFLTYRMIILLILVRERCTEN